MRYVYRTIKFPEYCKALPVQVRAPVRAAKPVFGRGEVVAGVSFGPPVAFLPVQAQALLKKHPTLLFLLLGQHNSKEEQSMSQAGLGSQAFP